MLYLVANINLFYFFTVLFGLVPRRWRRGGAGVAPGGAGWRRLLCDDCFDHSASIASCIALPAAGGLSRALPTGNAQDLCIRYSGEQGAKSSDNECKIAPDPHVSFILVQVRM